MSWQTLYMWKYGSSSNSYILANSKVFLKYVVGWDWLLLCPLSLNVGLTNLQKATWPLFGNEFT